MLGRVIRRFFIPSHRSSDPEVLLNIKLARAHDVAEVLSALESEDSSVAHQTFGLRMIARMVKQEPKSRVFLKDPRYEAAKSMAKMNVDKFGAREVGDICFWLRIMDKFNVKESKYFDETALTDRIRELCKNKEFTYRQEVNLLFDLSCLNRYVDELENNIRTLLNDPSQIFQLSELNQILIATKNRDRKSSKFILSDTLHCISRLNTDRLDVHSIINTLKFIGSMPNSAIKTVMNTKLMNALNDKIRFMSEIDILNVIAYYSRNPTTNKRVLAKIFEKISANLTMDGMSLTKEFLLNLLKKSIDVFRSQSIGIPKKVVNEIINLLNERFDELSEKDICSILLFSSKSSYQLPEELKAKLINGLEKSSQLLDLNFIMATRGLSNMCPDYPVGNLVKDERSLRASMMEQRSFNKVQIIEHISFIKSPHPLILSLKDLLVSDLTEQVKDIQSARVFLIELTKSERTAFTFSILEEVSKQAFSTLEADNLSENIAFILRKSIVVMNKQMFNWENYMNKIKHALNNAVIEPCLRDPSVPITSAHIHYLFSVCPPTDTCILMAAPKFSKNENASLNQLEAFLKLLNKVEGHTYSISDYYKLEPFFENVLLRNNSRKLEDYFNSLSKYLQTIELTTVKALKACSILAQHNFLDKELAEKAISVSEKNASGAALNYLLITASRYPYTLKDPASFFERVVDFSHTNSIPMVSGRLIAYLHWPNNNYDDKMEKAVIEKLDIQNYHRLLTSLPLLDSLNFHAKYTHRELVGSVTSKITEAITKNEDHIPLSDALKILESLSYNQYTRHISTYNSLIDNCKKNYKITNTDQKLSLVLSLARRGIKNREILEQCARDVLRYNTLAIHLPIVFSAIAEVGFHTENWAIELFEQALASRIPTSRNIVHWLWAILMFSAPEQHVATAIELYNSNNLSRMFHFRDVLIYNHFRQNTPPVPIQFQLDQSKMQSVASAYKHFGLTKFLLKRLVDSLMEQQKDVRVFEHVNGIFAPIYLPESSTAIWPLTLHALTYDKEHLRGKMMMHSQQLKNVSSRLLTPELVELKTANKVKEWVNNL